MSFVFNGCPVFARLHGRYYDCTIKEATAHGYKVIFPAYGNVEEVPLEYLQRKVVVSQAKVSRALMRGEKAKRFRPSTEESTITVDAFGLSTSVRFFPPEFSRVFFFFNGGTVGVVFL